jgi:nicotinate-nucleotide pyrophosphorylase (carboxylating)
MRYPDISLNHLISFVEEDTPFGDITTELIIPVMKCDAHVIAREETVIAGLKEIITLFNHYGVQTNSSYSDGNRVNGKTEILSLSGDAHSILKIERAALNLIGRMSGIATTTRIIQEKIASINPCCRLSATRKTAPGLRLIDKKAAMIGGADPHRFSLSDAILIKDTHRSLVPLDVAVKRAREGSIYHIIEAEAESVEEAVLAAQSGADIILLDNMNPEKIRECLDALISKGLRKLVRIEVSGGITPDTIEDFAQLEVERISLGMLTHTVRNSDFSLEIVQ